MGWVIDWSRESGELLQFHDNTLDRNRHHCAMKTKTAGIILVWLASVGFACASTNDITTLVQKGLFEEEANHHLDAAIDYYQEAIGRFDKDRQLTATAIFRLGECYRLQGKTNEANVQYERIVKEFADQTQLVELSRGYLPKENARSTFVSNLSKIQGGAIAGGVGPNPGTFEGQEELQEIRQIKDMIQNSPDLLNAPDRLATTARNGWMRATKLLIDNGATLNPESPRSWTPLTAAADVGNKGMVEFLITNGANINAPDGGNGMAPLHYAVNRGFKTVVETLLAHGANADIPGRDGERPLHLAAARGFTTMAELLLAHKAEVNAPGKSGETPIFRAIRENHPELVPLLISNKANVNFKPESGVTPLLAAMWKTGINISIVKSLLDSGADADATLEQHYPLDIAVKQGRADLVELLLQKKVNPDNKAPWNLYFHNDHSSGNTLRAVTPLILAISQGVQSNIIALLLQYSANPNLADETGETPLDYAIQHDNTNIMADLIAHHADVNAPDKQGDPPLAYASWADENQKGQLKQMLIQAGANEDYVRRGAIFITQKGTGSIGHKVFSMGTNSVNRYTLFELMASAYGSLGENGPRRPHFPGSGFGGGGPFGGGEASAVPFPDLAHVTINRLKADGSKEEIAVDLNEMLQTGDCSKNPRLEWGDIVLIPQLDHNVSESWHGLSQSIRDALGKCLLRKVKVVVKEQTTQFDLLPPIVKYTVIPGGLGWVTVGDGRLSPALAGTLKGENVLYTFDLNQVVHDANVLLISSDLSRVKVTRDDPATGGHPLVMEFNLETQPAPDITLRDGDVIEIPEREQK
jgi:ankyrin repeat protein